MRKTLRFTGKMRGNIVLIYTMEQRPYSEADRFSASQEFPNILCNPKVYYRIHKCSATCPYPEPARSSPYPHILFSEDPS
jgi:hypothetical protein